MKKLYYTPPQTEEQPVKLELNFLNSVNAVGEPIDLLDAADFDTFFS